MNKKELEATFSGCLKGFKKVRSTWVRETAAKMLQGVELQQSSWGGQFYVNLGVGLPDPNGGKRSVSQLDVVARLDQLAPNADILAALDLEQPRSVEERVAAIREALLSVALPFLDRLDTPDSLAEAYKAGELKNFAVRTRVRDL